MKQLFKNYSYEFDNNEIKILKTFCKQVLKQIESDNRFFSEVKSFGSILDKLENDDSPIKLTKDESTRLKNQLKQNMSLIFLNFQRLILKKKFLTL